MYKSLILFLIILSSLIANGQKKWEKDLDVANAYYEKHAFKQAIVYFEKVIQVKKNQDAYEKLGDSYFFLRQFSDANRVYNQIEKHFGSSDQTILNIAKTELSQGNYIKSKSFLQLLSDSVDTYTSDLLLASCDSILKWNTRPTSVRIANLKSLNSSFSEIAPANYTDKLVFSSDRINLTYKRSSEQTGANFFNLYFSSLNEKNKWQEAKNFGHEINSQNHEGAACFNSNGDDVYFTRSEYTQKDNLNHSDENRLKLYKSSKKNEHWSPPLWFMMNDSLHSFGHPTISDDENFFFFVADLPQGYGGTDIYLSVKLTDTTWSDPINLGEQINTPRNELYPYYTSNDELFFSSNGHAGYGAYDLFKTSYLKGLWQTPSNLGKGINSSYDDFSIIFINDNKGYLSSNRPGGKGREDLYLFILR